MIWLKRGRANDSLTELGQKVKNQLIMTAAKINVSEEGVTLFKDSPNHGVKYSVFIGDDHDSPTIAKIHKEVACSVEKWSDSTHATRTLVSPLQKIRSEKSSSLENLSCHIKLLIIFRNVFGTV